MSKIYLEKISQILICNFFLFHIRNDLGVVVKQPRLALGLSTLDNNLYNSSEAFCNYFTFILKFK